jgi:putative oxidoreductase
MSILSESWCLLEGSFGKLLSRLSPLYSKETASMSCMIQPGDSRRTTMRDLSLWLLSPIPLARWAPVPLRLIVGYGFIAHGVAKLMKGPDAWVAIVHALGVPAPFLMAWLTILVELLGGLAVLLGLLVPLASVPMAAVLLVAIFTVHVPFGFTSIKLMAVTVTGPIFGPPGYETDLLYLACLAALVVGGSGPLAVDGLITNRLRKTFV